MTPEQLTMLKQIAELRDQGILTEDEFSVQKAAILSGSESDKPSDQADPKPIQPEQQTGGGIHKQRIGMLVCALLGVVGCFLPYWLAVVDGAVEDQTTAFGGAGLTRLFPFMFAPTMVLCLISDKTRPLTGSKLLGAVAGPVLVSLYVIYASPSAWHIMTTTNPEASAAALLVGDIKERYDEVLVIGSGWYLLVGIGWVTAGIGYALGRARAHKVSPGHAAADALVAVKPVSASSAIPTQSAPKPIFIHRNREGSRRPTKLSIGLLLAITVPVITTTYESWDDAAVWALEKTRTVLNSDVLINGNSAELFEESMDNMKSLMSTAERTRFVNAIESIYEWKSDPHRRRSLGCYNTYGDPTTERFDAGSYENCRKRKTGSVLHNANAAEVIATGECYANKVRRERALIANESIATAEEYIATLEARIQRSNGPIVFDLKDEIKLMELQISNRKDELAELDEASRRYRYTYSARIAKPSPGDDECRKTSK